MKIGVVREIKPDEYRVDAICDSGAACVAYETVEARNGALPLLAPMSEIAGRLAAQAGGYFLEKPLGGRGLLLGGVAGVAPGRVVVIGGGIVGYNAAVIAIGVGANRDDPRALNRQDAPPRRYPLRPSQPRHVVGA